jgi:YHS domain-containing protein
VDGIFAAADLIPRSRPDVDSIVSRGIHWNYTTFLNLAFLLLAAALIGLTLRRGARDPVCGMTVDRFQTPHRRRYAGTTYYFCSAGCASRFDAHPEAYVGPGYMAEADSPGPGSATPLSTNPTGNGRGAGRR